MEGGGHAGQPGHTIERGCIWDRVGQQRDDLLEVEMERSNEFVN
jgi:hypothetical protein